jgi:hypothetical protein
MHFARQNDEGSEQGLPQEIVYGMVMNQRRKSIKAKSDALKKCCWHERPTGRDVKARGGRPKRDTLRLEGAAGEP